MRKLVRITPHFAVTGALQPEDFAEAAALGFKSIVSNLPDGESSAHLTAQQEAELAQRAGLSFRHIPTTTPEVFSERVVGGTSHALSQLPAPVLAHCAAGLRSAVAWAAAAARGQPVDCVLACLAEAGLNLEGIRGELENQHDPAHISPIPPALDAGCDGGI